MRTDRSRPSAMGCVMLGVGALPLAPKTFYLGVVALRYDEGDAGEAVNIYFRLVAHEP